MEIKHYGDKTDTLKLCCNKQCDEIETLVLLRGNIFICIGGDHGIFNA